MTTTTHHPMFIGIDPGKKGAFAFYRPIDKHLYVVDTPLLPSGRVDGREIARLLRPYGDAFTVIEQVHSLPNDGHVGAFNFGMSCGIVLGILDALGMGYFSVKPEVWKALLLLNSDKSESLERARVAFPDHAVYFALKKHDGRAEAALLAKLAAERFAPQ